MPVRSKARARSAIAAGLVAILPLSGCSGTASNNTGPVELTFLTGTVEATVKSAEGLADAFNAANPDIKVTVDASVPSGSEGDNLIKTRLATGETCLTCSGTTPVRCSRR